MYSVYFSNSLKNSEESHKDSGFFVSLIENIADSIFPDNTIDWNYIVRKGAHLFEFFLLGVIATPLSLMLVKKMSRTLLLSVAYLVVIALTDEFIQRFTGRTSSIKDVMIDIVGGCVGVATVLILRLAIDRKRERANCQN